MFDKFKDFITNYPTQIILCLIIIVIVLLVIILIDIHLKESFTAAKTVESYMFNTSNSKYITTSGSKSTPEKLKINIIADDMICITSGDKFLTNNSNLKFENIDLSIDLPNSAIFDIIFINPYEFILKQGSKYLNVRTYKMDSNINNWTSSDNIYINEDYIMKFKNISSNTYYTYKDLNIPYKFNYILYNNVEFSDEFDVVQLHKNGDENICNNDDNTSLLHWWHGAKNHPNSRYNIVYNIKTGETEIYRYVSGKLFRFNVYGYADGCCNIANLKLYNTNNKPAKNEIFKIKWIDEKLNQINILTNCGGVVGGEYKVIKIHSGGSAIEFDGGINHDKLVKAGKYEGNNKFVYPAKLTMYSYDFGKKLTKADFNIETISPLKKIVETVNKIMYNDSKVETEKLFENVEFRCADDESICVHKLGDINDFRNDLKLHWWNELNHVNSKHFVTWDAKNKLFSVYRVYGGIKYYWNVTNYADGCCVKTIVKFYKSTNDNIPHPADNEKFKLIPVEGKNDVFIIRTKCGGGFGSEGGVQAHDKDIMAGSSIKDCKFKIYNYKLNRYLTKSDFELDEGIAHVDIKNITSDGLYKTGTQPKDVYLNLKYKAYYLNPEYSCVNSADSTKQSFKFDEKNMELVNIKTGEKIKVKNMNYKPETGKGTIEFETPLKGDGRYWRGTKPMSDEARVKKLYVGNNYPVMKHPITLKENKAFVEINELNTVDTV